LNKFTDFCVDPNELRTTYASAWVIKEAGL
jgi:hypothetical protein